MALQAGAYLALVGSLRDWFPGSAPVPAAQQQIFLLGSLVLFIALVSPLDMLSGYLLSAHMVRHLLMTMVAPPLMLIGTPRWLFRPLLRLPPAPLVGRALTHPVVAFLAFNATFVIWHTPAYYDAALLSPDVHIIEHAIFFLTAGLAWWPIFSPLDDLPPLSDPLQCLYLFFQSIPPTILGALITFAGSPLYPSYTRMPRVWGLSPLDDQQLGGLIMWVPGALVYLAVLTVVFFRWFNRDPYEPAPAR